jgi:hypothetical protein
MYMAPNLKMKKVNILGITFGGGDHFGIFV